MILRFSRRPQATPEMDIPTCPNIPDAAAERLRLLVIGDGQWSADLLRHALDGMRPLIDVAPNAGTAHRYIAGALYDLIVLALPLADADGAAVCRQLRAGAVTCPILMLDSRDLVADIVAGFEAGADAYLVEPIAVEELRARLSALVRRHRQVLGAGGATRVRAPQPLVGRAAPVPLDRFAVER